MQQKICFNKRVGYLTLFGLVIVVAVVALNLLTKQQTYTNSKAAEIGESQPRLPTAAPKCNSTGQIIVKDSKTGLLYSWASVSNYYLGRLYCSSEPTTLTSPAPLEFPKGARESNYTTTFDTIGIGSSCKQFGVKILMTLSYLPGGTKLVYNPFPAGTGIGEYNPLIVSPELVGELDTKGNCKTDSSTAPNCAAIMETKRLSDGSLWSLNLSQCNNYNPRKNKCCSYPAVPTKSASKVI